MLPPYELKNKEFSKVMRGYNPTEVEEHLAFVLDKYTELYRENGELERKLKTAYARLDEIKNEEESIRNAMVNAQRASTKIMTEANDRADIIINTARKSCDRILADFKKKIQEERAILNALNNAITDYRERLLKAYSNQISMLEGIELLDENEIVKYALSDENYTSAVIQNIKQDILNMTSGESVLEEVQDDSFVNADSISLENGVRSSSVKDTIKELNKRILEDEDGLGLIDVSIETQGTTEEKSEAEIEAEMQYSDMLKILGAESNVDTQDTPTETPATQTDGEFNKAYETPKNYGDIIKRKNKN